MQVRTRFDGRWSAGFRVVGVDDGGYLVERVCDGSLLQARFSSAELRPADPGTTTPLPLAHRSTA